MSIIRIPSKYIYDKKLSKANDNKIELIEVTVKEVSPKNEYGVSVHNESVSVAVSGSKDDVTDMKAVSALFSSSPTYTYTYVIAYAGYTNIKTANFKIRGKILYDNNRVTYVAIKGENDKPEIGCTLVGRKKEGFTEQSYNARLTINGANQNISYIVIDSTDSIVYDQKKEDETPSALDIKWTTERKAEGTIYEGGSGRLSVTAKANIDFNKDLAEATFTQISDEEYEIEVKNLIVGATVVTASDGGYDKPLGSVSGTIEGNYITYIADRVEFTLYGNTISIELTDKILSTGWSSHSAYSFSGNELMQTTNYKKGYGDMIKNMYTDTEGMYELGKETATITCAVADYYDAIDGTIVKSIQNDARFNIGDIVIPMVSQPSGGDTPISVVEGGIAKTFEVLGVGYSYDGEVLQKLTLQERQERLQKLPTPEIWLGRDGTTNEPYIWITVEGEYFRRTINIIVNGKVISSFVEGLGGGIHTLIYPNRLGIKDGDTVAVNTELRGYIESDWSNALVYEYEKLQTPIWEKTSDTLATISVGGRAQDIHLSTDYGQSWVVPSTTTVINAEKFGVKRSPIIVTAYTTAPYYKDSDKASVTFTLRTPMPKIEVTTDANLIIQNPLTEKETNYNGTSYTVYVDYLEVLSTPYYTISESIINLSGYMTLDEQHKIEVVAYGYGYSPSNKAEVIYYGETGEEEYNFDVTDELVGDMLELYDGDFDYLIHNPYFPTYIGEELRRPEWGGSDINFFIFDRASGKFIGCDMEHPLGGSQLSGGYIFGWWDWITDNGEQQPVETVDGIDWYDFKQNDGAVDGEVTLGIGSEILIGFDNNDDDKVVIKIIEKKLVPDEDGDMIEEIITHNFKITAVLGMAIGNMVYQA